MNKKQYREKLISSIKLQGHRNEDREDIYYFENAYADKIREYFKEKGIKSLELNYSKRSKTTSICSFLSSGRLCYNYFRSGMEKGKFNNIVFELPLQNDLVISKRFPTKMDAADLNNRKYYECKCDEISSDEHELLSISYWEKSALFKEFGIDESLIQCVPIIDSKKKVHCYIKFPASALVDFGDLVEANPKYKSCYYNELYFDLKQFMCHLMALAHIPNEEDKELIYLIFVPDTKHDYLFTNAVEKEMQCIKASSKIQKFFNAHNISFSWEFIPIGDVEDFNYLESYPDEMKNTL